MRMNIRIGGNKKHGISILFFFSLPNNNVGGSVNQSIITREGFLRKNIVAVLFFQFYYK